MRQPGLPNSTALKFDRGGTVSTPAGDYIWSGDRLPVCIRTTMQERPCPPYLPTSIHADIDIIGGTPALDIRSEEVAWWLGGTARSWIGHIPPTGCARITEFASSFAAAWRRYCQAVAAAVPIIPSQVRAARHVINQLQTPGLELTSSYELEPYAGRLVVTVAALAIDAPESCEHIRVAVDSSGTAELCRYDNQLTVGYAQYLLRGLAAAVERSNMMG